MSDDFVQPRRPHVLAVDDDSSIRQLLQLYLADRGMRVSAVAGEREMAAVLDEDAADIVLLDLKLGGADGMQVARRLRDRSVVPIIILTANQDEADRVMGLELGADDYLTKPFSPRELLARIRALLRRVEMGASVAAKAGDEVRFYRFAGWELNVRTRQLRSADGRTMALRNSEFNLLVALLCSPRRVLSRDRLIELSRLRHDDVFDRAVDVQIGRLRRKLEVDARSPVLIVTERGVGYVFDADVAVAYE